ncbi:MAG: fumarate hydratase C-terminal domain-containing protein, partial [Rhodoferax sp.]|uniref:fumarate hydratase C-terminal domain-containing protein n=2 Tax=Rhodoferax sp. TaxID=50421 RepID=UPI003265C9F2
YPTHAASKPVAMIPNCAATRHAHFVMDGSGPVAIEAIKKHTSAYLMAVGGAAYLVSKAIKTAKVVGFADMGMEAIYEFDVVDMPVTVAVDAGGTSAHITGPAEWQKKIATGEFKNIGVVAA